MRGTFAFAVVVVTLLAPLGASTDLLHPRVCDPALGCIAPSLCVPGFFCQADPCDPAARCEGRLHTQPGSCVVNATIQGQTCTTHADIYLAAHRSVVLPLFGPTGANAVSAGVAVVQGDVRSFNLPNGWIMPSAYAALDVAGVRASEASVSVYRSDIIVPGEPILPILTGDEHVYSQTTVEVRYGAGPTMTHAIVGIIQLDHIPDGCYVRTSMSVLSTFNCPRFSTLLI